MARSEAQGRAGLSQGDRGFRQPARPPARARALVPHAVGAGAQLLPDAREAGVEVVHQPGLDHLVHLEHPGHLPASPPPGAQRGLRERGEEAGAPRARPGGGRG